MALINIYERRHGNEESKSALALLQLTTAEAVVLLGMLADLALHFF